MIGDPEDYRAVARSLRATKHVVEDDIRHLANCGSVFGRWMSPAADQFSSSEFQSSLQSYQFVVRDLDELAGVLERAASQLEDARTRIRSIESRARHWFAVQPPQADGGPPLWEREWWRYRPGRFPVAGDSGWFDAARFLRIRGVPV